jgi:hypothetical protein
MNYSSVDMRHDLLNDASAHQESFEDVYIHNIYSFSLLSYSSTKSLSIRVAVGLGFGQKFLLNP